MFKTSIPKEAPSAPASAGTRQPARKHSECDSGITDATVLKRKPEIVTDVEEVRSAAAKAIKIQVDGDGIENSNPKKRARNYSGREE